MKFRRTKMKVCELVQACKLARLQACKLATLQACKLAKLSRLSRSAKKLSSAAFDGLRSIINLVRGCKMVLTRNVAYKCGFANGTRGDFIGAVYGAGGVGTFPDALIGEFPDYVDHDHDHDHDQHQHDDHDHDHDHAHDHDHDLDHDHDRDHDHDQHHDHDHDHDRDHDHDVDVDHDHDHDQHHTFQLEGSPCNCN